MVNNLQARNTRAVMLRVILIKNVVNKMTVIFSKNLKNLNITAKFK